MDKDTSTSWGNVAEWYHDLLEKDTDSYQQKVVLPNLARLIEQTQAKKLVDIACGEGFFSRAFSKLGLKVTGADIGKELIAIAKRNSAEIEYHVAASHELGMIGAATGDVAIIVLALQNIEKYKETLLEASRVLVPNGRLFIVLNHPTFRIPKRSSWQYDEENNIQYRRVDEYLSESKSDIAMQPGKGEKSKTTVSFHRPLQSYSKALQKAGFAISRIEEWTSHKKSEDGTRKVAEDRARKEIPLFMCIEAIKLS